MSGPERGPVLCEHYGVDRIEDGCGNRARWLTPHGSRVCGRHRYPRQQRTVPWPVRDLHE